MKMLLKLLPFLFLFYVLSSKGQVNHDWQLKYCGPNMSGTCTHDMKTDPYGDLYICGEYGSSWNPIGFVRKFSEDGDSLWSTTFPSVSPKTMYTDYNRNTYIVGNARFVGGGDIIVMKFDSTGQQLWYYTYGNPFGTEDQGLFIEVDDFGGVVVMGNYHMDNGPDAAIVLKLNDQGLYEWSHVFENPTFQTNNNVPAYASILEMDKAGNVYVSGTFTVFGAIFFVKISPSGMILWQDDTGFSNCMLGGGTSFITPQDDGSVYVGANVDACTWSTGFPLPDSSYFIVRKYDAAGGLLWERSYPTVMRSVAHAAAQKHAEAVLDENQHLFYATVNYAGGDNGSVQIMRLDKDNGAILDSSVVEMYPQHYFYLFDMGIDNQHNIYVQGLLRYDTMWTDGELLMVKLDEHGNRIWENKYDPAPWLEYFTNVYVSDQGAVYAFADYFDDSWNTVATTLYQLCSNCNNFIYGNVFHDENMDCVAGGQEYRKSNWLVEANPGSYYASTDEEGNYLMMLPDGNYTLSFVEQDRWTAACSNTYSIDLDSSQVINDINFALEISDTCHDLSVDIGVGNLRPCFSSFYSIQYCNNGTIHADSAYILLEMNEDISIDSSSLPIVAMGNELYRIDLGTIAVGDCGQIFIWVTIACDAVLGSTNCVQGNIFPESDCGASDPNWDGSSIMVEGSCEQDSLACFVIFNTGDFGNDDMTTQSEYRIYKNNVLVYTGYFQLVGGDSLPVCWPADGNTIRLEADQSPGHPGNSFPQEHIELCGGPSYTLGQIIIVPDDDQDSDVSIVCREITAAYDPNIKSVEPAGWSENHYIVNGTKLNYQIDFQNTGTDTAFKVVVMDTLSDLLDVPSFAPGASSHNYSYRIFGEGIIEWTFEHIMLPDSNTNEPESHGFVRFSIDLKEADLAHNTLIENKAAIYFDYNEPIITNTAYNQIYDTIFTVLTGYDVPAEIELKAYPNPFREEFRVEFASPCHEVQVQLFNLNGQLLNQLYYEEASVLSLSLQHQPAGMYLVNIQTREGSQRIKMIKKE